MQFVSGLRGRYQGYSGARPDIVSLLPSGLHSLLDVGCGAGMTGLLVKNAFPNVRLVGVEPDPSLAELATQHFDIVFETGIDTNGAVTRLAAHAPYDVIVCADVLEHVVNPVAVLLELRELLSEEGVLITSIPNVRHWSTFLSLGLMGTWPARDRGIHDRTHLRFFARRDILALGNAADLRMRREKRNLRLIESIPTTAIPAKLLDFWPLRPFLTFQYLHVWAYERRSEFLEE